MIKFASVRPAHGRTEEALDDDAQEKEWELPAKLNGIARTMVAAAAIMERDFFIRKRGREQRYANTLA